MVGGISRTARYQGYRFDIGGHRFFTKVRVVEDLWREILGDELLERPRLSRIYYRGHFFDYPLRPMNALLGLGPFEAVRIVASYAKVKLFPLPEERSFEQWVTNRFGRRLYELFFKSYTEKVWGMPCSEIGADWAAQRIKNLDLLTALKNTLLGQATRGGEVVTTLIDRFLYPRLGPGMMWERCQEDLAAAGTETMLGARVTRLAHDGGRILAVDVEEASGRRTVEADEVISSMPMRELVTCLDPPAPEEVRAAAERLRYRDFLTVALIVDRAELFPDNWIYVHSPEVRMGRIQNFKNWSPEMVPDPATTCLGLEYFVQQGDDLWTADDDALVDLGRRECARLGLIEEGEVTGGTVIRMPKAYPVYDAAYGEAVATIRDYVTGFSNLQLIGRNGQHRYNNQDHSMLAGIFAARNVVAARDGVAARHDLWGINVEQEYHEEIREGGEEEAAGETAAESGDRLVPQRVGEPTLEELLQSTFARFDPVALGVSVGTVASVALALATAILLLRGGDQVGPNLSLLGNYFVGFTVSWPGLAIGAVEAGAGGFVFGAVLALLINLLVGAYETSCRMRIEMASSLSMLEEPDP